MYATLKTSTNDEIPEDFDNEDSGSELSAERYMKNSDAASSNQYHSVHERTYVYSNLQ